MRNKKIDYKNGKIYVIRRPDPDQPVYIGSTCQTLKERLRCHKKDNEKKWKGCSSREVLKFEDSYIELLEDFECNNVKELEAQERFWIENMNCVNKLIPGVNKRSKKIESIKNQQNQVNNVFNNLIKLLEQD